jgi:hypothetical protein
VEIANCAKRLDRGFHCIASERAMHVKVNKTRREIISVEINNVFPARLRLLANLRDFFSVNDELKSIANAIGKNQTRIAKNHRL